jgi:2-hydroxy-3-keto-5-methylthiopentenyl-1-phosphate phosphatase
MRCHVYVDFDGTIAPDDPTDALFARFADPSWRVIEEEWQQGRLSASECMKQQVRLLRATPTEIAGFLAQVRIDEGAPEFFHLCRRYCAEVTVVSDGLDLVVGTVLKRSGLDFPFFANRLEWQGRNRWRLKFPHWRTDCSARLGNCKCAHRRSARNGLDIMVGDGRSDFCIAKRCDLVLAKGQLGEYCRQHGVAHVAIKNFFDATSALSQWLATRLDGRSGAVRPIAVEPHQKQGNASVAMAQPD